MKLQTFQFTQKKGWSVEKLGELDSENTLILVFAAPEFISNPAPIQALHQYYPHAKMVGCSSAGEIAAEVNAKPAMPAMNAFTKPRRSKLTSSSLGESLCT